MKKTTMKQLRSIITELTKEQIEQLVSTPVQSGMCLTKEDIKILEEADRKQKRKEVLEKRKRIIKKLLSEE